MRTRLIFATAALLLLSFQSCQNIEGTEEPNPKTFIKVYEGPYGYTAASIETTADGYVILGNSVDQNNNPVTAIFKIDKNGNRVGTTSYITGGSGSSIKALPSGGFVMAGDSVYNQANPENVNDFQIISSTIYILNDNLNPVQKVLKTDQLHATGKIDFKSTGIAVSGDKLILLGTYQESDDKPIKPFIQTFKKNGSVYEEDWYKPISLLDQDYQNAKSVFYSNGKITWATAIANEQQNFNFSYVSIPTLQEGSVYVNNSLMGATTEQLFIPTDIYPYGVASGYGVIGTYGTTTKTNKNMFFVRVDQSGSIVNGSEKYFDGVSITTDRSVSEIEDTGEAIVGTSDNGFILAGTMTTIPGRVGNGARDIFLVKTNENGEVIWNKTLGGSGDEVVRTVRENEDGSIMIFGTNTIGGFSSIFLMKINPSGDL
jgi:hypothetical protein